MNYQPYPGYEMLWNLKMDVNSKKQGKNTAFDRQLKELFEFKKPSDVEIYDSTIPGLDNSPDVPIRIYRKKGIKNSPLVINIHGGGFISGDLNNDNNRASMIAKNVPCTVISVDYRLAPKHVFPKPLEDCYAVLKYAYNHADQFNIDKDKIALFGTSAGGTLAAGLALYVRDHGGPEICLQLLNFPGLDYKVTTHSATQFYEGSPLIEGKDLPKTWEAYLGGFDGKTPSYYAAPLVAENLSNLPPAFIITCEYDPLRDQGLEYSKKLLEHGISTEIHNLSNVPHGFDLINGELTQWIREGMYLSLRKAFNLL